MDNLSGRQHEFLRKLFTLAGEYKDANVTAIGQGMQNAEYVVLINIYLREGDRPGGTRRKSDRTKDDCAET